MLNAKVMVTLIVMCGSQIVLLPAALRYSKAVTATTTITTSLTSPTSRVNRRTVEFYEDEKDEKRIVLRDYGIFVLQRSKCRLYAGAGLRLSRLQIFIFAMRRKRFGLFV